MPDDRNQAAIRATAQLITDDDARAIAAGLDAIPAEEVIVEPNPAEYISPAYLQKTAPQLAPEFAQLLGLLRDLNARFVGERTVDAQAAMSLTGEHEWLEEEFLRWCGMYFKIRGSHDRLNPQNGSDPWRLYQDCCKEAEELLEKRIVQPGTINSSVLNLSQRFMHSAFAEEVLGPDLKNYAAIGRDRYGGVTSRQNAIRQVSDWRKAVRSFTEFLQQTARHIPSRYAPVNGPEWLASTEAAVARLAEDLTFLRNVLCVLPVNHAEKKRLSPDLWARLIWSVYHGGSVATVLTSSSPEPSTERATNHELAFRRDGWLCHREFPWLRVQPNDMPDQRRTLPATNWYILDTLTSPLYEAWDRLDPGPVVSRGLEADATDEEQTAAIAVALAEPDTAEVPTPVVRHRKTRIPQFRLSEFEKITTDHFRCEWSQAKGSERKVFRHGGKQFTFGCHGINRTVQPEQIKNCLRKLGIPIEDFIATCH